MRISLGQRNFYDHWIDPDHLGVWQAGVFAFLRFVLTNSTRKVLKTLPFKKAMNLVGSRFFEGHLRKGFVSFVRSRRELRLATWEKGIAPEIFY